MPQFAAANSDRPDVIIVGAGLAGCCLAWRCWQRGLSVLLVDSSDPRNQCSASLEHSSSAIAAGLVTPIQGQRFATPENYAAEFEAISNFYTEIDEVCDSQTWLPHPSIRVIQSQERRERFVKRCVNSADTPRAIAPHARVLKQEVTPDAWGSSFGAFEMQMAARLRIGEFRAATVAQAESVGCWKQESVSKDEISQSPDGIQLINLGLESSTLVMCTGIKIDQTQWTRNLQARYAGGEVLVIELQNVSANSLDALRQYSAIHHHGWCFLLQPADDRIPVVSADDLSSPLQLGQLRVQAEGSGNLLVMFGATYRDGTVLELPTTEGVAELTERFSQSYRGEFRLRAVAAATRPVISGRKPVYFWGGDHGRLGFFGGLASHGVRTAPLVAERLLNSMPPRATRAD